MKRSKYLIISALFFLTGCGYQQTTTAIYSAPISIPVVKNDENGHLRAQLAQKMGESKKFRYSSSVDAKYELVIDVSGDRIETVGHSKGVGKSLGKLVPTQGNRFITAKVKVLEKASGKEIVAPFVVTASVDFDFITPTSEEDIYWKTPKDKKIEMLQYSYGQLDSKESAEKECQEPLFDRLSSQIVSALSRVNINA